MTALCAALFLGCFFSRLQRCYDLCRTLLAALTTYRIARRAVADFSRLLSEINGATAPA